MLTSLLFRFDRRASIKRLAYGLISLYSSIAISMIRPAAFFIPLSSVLVTSVIAQVIKGNKDCANCKKRGPIAASKP